jgi:hypothetical protein
MEVLQREGSKYAMVSLNVLGTDGIDLKSSICSHYRESVIYMQEFEKIDSPGSNMDSSQIKSILVPYNPNEEYFLPELSLIF